MTEQVIAYQRKSLADHAVIDLVALDLPEQNFPTQALWYVLADELAGPGALPPEVLLGALHATEHSQIAVLPLLAMCDRWDIGGLSTNVHFQTGLPTIFIYDGHPAGSGSPAAATTSSSAWSPTPRGWSASARARAAARRASRARSAATSTSRCTRRARWS